jgi:hypothetical protein
VSARTNQDFPDFVRAPGAYPGSRLRIATILTAATLLALSALAGQEPSRDRAIDERYPQLPFIKILCGAVDSEVLARPAAQTVIRRLGLPP